VAMIEMWDAVNEDTRRLVNTVDVEGWAASGYVISKDAFVKQPADVQAYLTDKVTAGKAEFEGGKKKASAKVRD
jgi:hypothetical protein